jgi:hypothetical protein
MKRLSLLILAVVLVGCSSAPIVPKWPAVPEDLKVTCPDLKEVDPKNDKLSVIVEVVTDNYKQYYDCKAKVDDWIEWYNGQQKIWEKLK